MKSTIEELWYGDLCPNNEFRRSTQKAKILTQQTAAHRNSLQATLTEQQKELLEKLDECQAELTDINEREIFAHGFRLGARLAMEIMSSDIE